jgi:peptidyl-tRNA hydrolase
MNEKRIFVVVAETVQSGVECQGNWAFIPNPELSKSTNQVCGRIAAQVAHVVSKMQVERAFKNILKAISVDTHIPYNMLSNTLEPVTTIVLSVRDSLELYHIWNILNKDGIQCTDFMDDNPIYGTTENILTAVCTYPIEPEKLRGLTTHLPLWRHGKTTPADL